MVSQENRKEDINILEFSFLSQLCGHLGPWFLRQEQALRALPLQHVSALVEHQGTLVSLCLRAGTSDLPLLFHMGGACKQNRAWLRVGINLRIGGRLPDHQRAPHLLAFLPSVCGLLSFSASLSSSVGLWGSERGNAVFNVSTMALTTICRARGAGQSVRSVPRRKATHRRTITSLCFAQ